MKNIKPLLNYFSIQKGKTSLVVDGKTVNLVTEGFTWMGLDLENYWQAYEFIYELNNAYGVVTTSGLGLGILQTHLLQKPTVSKVIVYEYNLDVIDIFKELAIQNQFNIDRLEIRHANIDKFPNIKTDCLYLDHFEAEPTSEIVEKVKHIANHSDYDQIWYWPAAHHFLLFCQKICQPPHNDSYQLWKDSSGIAKLPNSLNETDVKNLVDLQDRYINHASYSILGQRLITSVKRNNLKKYYSSIKKYGGCSLRVTVNHLP